MARGSNPRAPRCGGAADPPPLLAKSGLVEGRVLRRYKRFLCDVELAGGRIVTAHCANTGTMASCWEEGDPVLLEPSGDPRRKLRYTWICCRRGGHWVGVHTGVPNRVVAEAARRDLLPGLSGLGDVRTEVRYGVEGSRIDVLARDGDGRLVYIEVKNTTLRTDGPGGAVVRFPDAVTVRGAKHLRELRAAVGQGHRAAVVFFVHRRDVAAFEVAAGIDPAYADELELAADAGVEILPIQARLRVRPHPSRSWSVAWSLTGLLPWRRNHGPPSGHR